MAVLVGQDLHLDMAPVLDVPLEQHGVVTEGRRCLPTRGRDRSPQVRRRADDTHALAAAARCGLHQKRETDLLGHHREVGRRRVRGWHDGDSGGDGDDAGVVLAAHRVHHVGSRSDEHQPGVGDGACEGGALGEEPVAGVHRIRAGLPRSGQQRRDGEIGLGGGCGADPDRRVGLPHVGGVAVGVAVDGDAGEPLLGRGADHPEGDLATVRNEDGAESGHGRLTSGRRRSAARGPARSPQRPTPCPARGGCRPGR